MKNDAKPNLPKLERGQHITVVMGGTAFAGRVTKASGGRMFTWRVAHVAHRVSSSELRKNVNITWAFGWDTEQANALQAQVALCR